MNCEILETLYLRSNGDIPCNDDAGETIRLAALPEGDEAWVPTSAFSNPNYSKIRESFSRGVAPWPDVCVRCAFFRPHEPFPDSGAADRTLKKIQVEPSLACNLRCPCCTQHLQIGYRPKPWLMAPETLGKALRGLADERWSVDQIEYCGQGDPLMNPQFSEFVRTSRRYFPATRQRLITNGNFDYSKSVRGEPLDEIFVSCDGAFQKSYEQYRVGGDVRRPLRFMQDAPRSLEGRPQTLVWKYILFEFNDGDEEIIAAQRMAQDLEVDQLMFVFTHSRFKSLRFTAQNAGSFPIAYPNVTTSATPIHLQGSRIVSPVEPLLGPQTCGRACDCVAMVDELTVSTTRISVRGWALSRRPIRAIRARFGEHDLGVSSRTDARPDVRRAYETYEDPLAGFRIAASIGGLEAGFHTLILEIVTGDSPGCRFSRVYQVG